MKKVTKDVLKDAAHKMMFDMDEKEYSTLLEEFSSIQEQMELIGNIKGVDDAEPMTFPFPVSSSLREDETSFEMSADDIYSNNNCVKEKQIKIPKVIK